MCSETCWCKAEAFPAHWRPLFTLRAARIRNLEIWAKVIILEEPSPHSHKLSPFPLTGREQYEKCYLCSSCLVKLKGGVGMWPGSPAVLRQCQRHVLGLWMGESVTPHQIPDPMRGKAQVGMGFLSRHPSLPWPLPQFKKRKQGTSFFKSSQILRNYNS
jgi:hypothetical protein